MAAPQALECANGAHWVGRGPAVGVVQSKAILVSIQFGQWPYKNYVVNDLLTFGLRPFPFHYVVLGLPLTDQTVQKLLDNDLRIFGLRFFSHDPTVLILKLPIPPHLYNWVKVNGNCGQL